MEKTGLIPHFLLVGPINLSPDAFSALTKQYVPDLTVYRCTKLSLAWWQMNVMGLKSMAELATGDRRPEPEEEAIPAVLDLGMGVVLNRDELAAWYIGNLGSDTEVLRKLMCMKLAATWYPSEDGRLRSYVSLVVIPDHMLTDPTARMMREAIDAIRAELPEDTPPPQVCDQHGNPADWEDFGVPLKKRKPKQKTA